jgi:hypothetical protein
LDFGDRVLTLKVGERVAESRCSEFGFEEIGFVQEEEDARVGEPSDEAEDGGLVVERKQDGRRGEGEDEPRVGNRVEQRRRLCHSICGGILRQQLVELGNRDDKEHNIDVLKAMNPLFAFAPLSSNIETPERERPANLERRFRDSCRFDSTPEDILIRGDIACCAQALD